MLFTTLQWGLSLKIWRAEIHQLHLNSLCAYTAVYTSQRNYGWQTLAKLMPRWNTCCNKLCRKLNFVGRFWDVVTRDGLLRRTLTKTDRRKNYHAIDNKCAKPLRLLLFLSCLLLLWDNVYYFLFDCFDSHNSRSCEMKIVNSWSRIWFHNKNNK